jgi:hypothetical protein
VLLPSKITIVNDKSFKEEECSHHKEMRNLLRDGYVNYPALIIIQYVYVSK